MSKRAFTASLRTCISPGKHEWTKGKGVHDSTILCIRHLKIEWTWTRTVANTNTIAVILAAHDEITVNVNKLVLVQKWKRLYTKPLNTFTAAVVMTNRGVSVTTTKIKIYIDLMSIPNKNLMSRLTREMVNSQPITITVLDVSNKDLQSLRML